MYKLEPNLNFGVVTWQKSINSVRAAVAEGRALEHFREGDLERTVEELDKAIDLAPGVPNYYNNRAQVYLAYQLRPELFTEAGCDQQVEVSYLNCLGIQSLDSNLEAVNKQPFNFRARLAAGNSAFNLQLNESALGFYADAASMVPNAWGIRNDLAESQIDVGLYDEALSALERSLEITGDSFASSRALYLKGRALNELGQLDEALETLRRRLSFNHPQASLDLIGDIYSAQGVRFDIDRFDRAINDNPEDAVAFYFRGLAYLKLGDAAKAASDIESGYSLGLKIDQVLANKEYARLKTGDHAGAQNGLFSVLESEPQNPLFNAYNGELQMFQGNYADALNLLENANILDPDLGLAYLIRGKLYMSLGLQQAAVRISRMNAKRLAAIEVLRHPIAAASVP